MSGKRFKAEEIVCKRRGQTSNSPRGSTVAAVRKLLGVAAANALERRCGRGFQMG
jgi:hypothetical protein